MFLIRSLTLDRTPIDPALTAICEIGEVGSMSATIVMRRSSRKVVFHQAGLQTNVVASSYGVIAINGIYSHSITTKVIRALLI